MSAHHWKSKRTDFLFTIILLVVSMCVFHVIIALGPGKRSHSHHTHPQTFEQRLTNPMHIALTIIGSLLAFSPLYVFRRKVPRELILDTDQRLLTVLKRTKKKPQTITLENSGYHYYSLTAFSVFEIYNDFHTTRGPVRRRYLTVLIPKIGMSITDKDLKQLVALLKKEGVCKENGAKTRSWNELIGE